MAGGLRLHAPGRLRLPVAEGWKQGKRLWDQSQSRAGLLPSHRIRMEKSGGHWGRGDKRLTEIKRGAGVPQPPVSHREGCESDRSGSQPVRPGAGCLTRTREKSHKLPTPPAASAAEQICRFTRMQSRVSYNHRREPEPILRAAETTAAH